MSDAPRRSLLVRLFSLAWKLVTVLLKLVVMLSVLLSLAMVWMALRGSHVVHVENNTPLILAPSGELVDQIDVDESQRLLQNFRGDPPSQSSLRDLVDALEAAKNDPRIPFVVLKFDAMTDAGLPQLQELVVAMKDFQSSGKKIIAWSPWYEQAGFYAIAYANEVVLDPMGSVNVEGFSSYTNYFKDALDKLGVDVHVFRVGEYKSAVEPFTRNDMSPEARAANREWLGDLWTIYGQGLGQARKLPATVADDYVHKLADGLAQNGGDSAAYAKSSGLVTSIETLGEFRKRMTALVGFDDDIGSFRQIHYLDYLASVDHDQRRAKPKSGSDKGTVGLVVVQGEIVDGDGEIGQAGGEAISDLLDEARRDPQVAAVVLRVNSPGGSVWASEQIRRAVDALKADGKPVVASMSTVAASGGYWISMDADRIFAHDATITGSIGIFGMMPSIDRALGKFGVHTDGVGTTSLAGGQRIDRPMSAELSRIMQSQIDKGYRDFIGGVAAARKIPVDKVNGIARGRVWSGERAKSLGLVDEIGGLQQAADAAAKLAGIDDGQYELEEMQPKRDFTSELLSRFSGEARALLLPKSINAWLTLVDGQVDAQQWLSAYNDPRGMYARCYCTIATGHRLKP